MAWFVIFNHSIRSFEIIPVFSLFLFRGTPHRDTPGADLHDCRGSFPPMRQETCVVLFKNNRIPVNPACRPSCRGVGQGGLRTSCQRIGSDRFFRNKDVNRAYFSKNIISFGLRINTLK